MGGGGPSTTTTTVDPTYNAGMLKLSQEEQGWARKMFNQYMYGVDYDPTEVQTGTYINGKWTPKSKVTKDTTPGAYIKNPNYKPATPGHFDSVRNIEGVLEQVWVPGSEAQGEQYILDPKYKWETKTLGQLKGYKADEITSEQEYLQNLVEANQSLLGLQTDVSKQRLELGSSLLSDLNKGIDVNARQNEAQAAVQQGFKNARKANAIDLQSYGLDPSSGKYASQNRELAMSEGANVAAARTTAKDTAEQEDIQRKALGLQVTA